MKRRLLGMVLCAVVGAIVTVAVAWRASYLGARPGVDRQLTPQEAAGLWRYHVPVEWGHETIIVNDVLMPVWGHETIEGWIYANPGISRVGLFSELDTGSRVDSRPRRCRYIQAGWPFRALEGVEWREPQGTARRALWEPSSRRFLGRDTRHSYPYPLGPLWPGFVADTLLFAAVSWLLAAAARRTRCRARLDRGTCPQCKFDLRAATGNATITCPECGAQIAAAWLARPRQALRWWMVPAVVPAALLGAQLLGGRITWPMALRQLLWHDSVATCVTIAVFLALAASLYVLALRSYGDRSRGPRHLLSVSVAVAIGGLLLLPLYVLVALVVA